MKRRGGQEVARSATNSVVPVRARGGQGGRAMALSQQRASGRAEKGRLSGLGDRIRRFLRDVRAEMRKVVWPSRKELTTYTLVVIVTVLVVAVLMGIVDLAVSEFLALVGGFR